MTTLTKEQFFEFRTKFKAEANAKSISAADLLLYNIIRNKDPKHGFTEITNKHKLDNGANKWQGYQLAASDLTWSLGHYAKTIRMRFGEAVADYVNAEIKNKQL